MGGKLAPADGDERGSGIDAVIVHRNDAALQRVEEITAAATGIEERIALRHQRREQLGRLSGAGHLLGLAAGPRGIEIAHRRAMLPDAMAPPAIVAQLGGHARLPVTMKAEAMK